MAHNISFFFNDVSVSSQFVLLFPPDPMLILVMFVITSVPSGVGRHSERFRKIVLMLKTPVGLAAKTPMSDVVRLEPWKSASSVALGIMLATTPFASPLKFESINRFATEALRAELWKSSGRSDGTKAFPVWMST